MSEVYQLPPAEVQEKEQQIPPHGEILDILNGLESANRAQMVVDGIRADMEGTSVDRLARSEKLAQYGLGPDVAEEPTTYMQLLPDGKQAVVVRSLANGERPEDTTVLFVVVEVDPEDDYKIKWDKKCLTSLMTQDKFNRVRSKEHVEFAKERNKSKKTEALWEKLVRGECGIEQYHKYFEDVNKMTLRERNAQRDEERAQGRSTSEQEDFIRRNDAENYAALMESTFGPDLAEAEARRAAEENTIEKRIEKDLKELFEQRTQAERTQQYLEILNRMRHNLLHGEMEDGGTPSEYDVRLLEIVDAFMRNKTGNVIEDLGDIDAILAHLSKVMAASKLH